MHARYVADKQEEITPATQHWVASPAPTEPPGGRQSCTLQAAALGEGGR